MNHELIVSESVEILAPLEAVWKGLTDPEIIKEYLFGTETVTDWAVGSEVVFQGGEGETAYRDRGQILENLPNERISYSYWSGFSGLEDKPENYATVTYDLRKLGDNKTEFTWTQKGFANESGYEHSRSGMADFLQSIKKIIEGIS